MRYRELTDLEGVTSDSPEAVTARIVMETSPQVLALLADIGRWPGTVVNNHKSASQTFHSLSLAAALGVSAANPAISSAVERIMEHMGPDGMPRLPMTYPAHFGGPGVVAPVLGSFRGPGKKTDPCPYATLVSLELAVACSASSPSSCIAGGVPAGDTGNDKPYADIESSSCVLSGIEALLSCWERSRDWHPYI